MVDLWAIYNRVRGIELISPSDLESAAKLFEKLDLPVRLRKFKSGLLVVQDRYRSDESVTRAIISWMEGLAANRILGDQEWGVGISAIDAAEKFGWSLAVATEELEMVEERGAICRDSCIEGVRWWKTPWELASL